MFTSPERAGINRLKPWLVALVGVLALAGCSSPNTQASTSPTVAVNVEPQATLKKLNPAESSGQILFAASEAVGAQHDIYKKDLHTGEVTNLTNSETDELNPQVSPDGNTAVFAGQNKKGIYQIYSMKIGSGEITQLTDHDANYYDPTFTPNGKILFKSTVDNWRGDIWEMDNDGKNQRNLTPGMNNTEQWKATAVGKYIVFTSRHADDGSMDRKKLAGTDELWVLYQGEEGVKPVRLTKNTWPDWYPEADPARPGVIAYTSKATSGDPGGPDTIFEMNITDPNIAEKNRKQLTDPNVLPGDSSDCSWAPNGTLLFVNNAEGEYAAYALTPDKTYVKLAEAPGGVLSPVAVNKKITIGVGA